MKNNDDNQKNTELLRKLQIHMATLPERKPGPFLPDCHCMKFFGPLVKRGFISGQKVCLYCKPLMGRFKKKEECPFIEED